MRIQRRLLALAMIGLITLGALAATYAWWQDFLDEPLPISSTQIIDIRPGNSLGQVVNLLSRQTGLAYPRVFSYWAAREGFERSIRAGEFAISPGMSPRAALLHIVTGPAVQYSVTFIEGTTVRIALNALWSSPKLQKTLQELDDKSLLSAINEQFPFLEGSIFPDTYFYTAGTTDLELLRRANNRLQQVLDEEWRTRAQGLPYETAFEALTMASIIEKESGLISERERIAGVFVRRLQRGMRLQSDPTVIYGMGEHFDGNLRRVDLDTTTAYNTYRINGLPPSPIAMAGRDAIHASLNPSDETYLYFVATGEGGHYFSSTLNEHNAAVRRYQLSQRQSANQ